jgi:hypothetical protein
VRADVLLTARLEKRENGGTRFSLFFSGSAFWMSSSLTPKMECARGRFRQDVADQLRMAAAKAGLAGTVTLHQDRAILQFEEAAGDDLSPRIVVLFNEEGGGEENVCERVSLYVEAGEERTALLSLAWRGGRESEGDAIEKARLADLEARTGENLPLELRGLNASADMRTGRYAKGDVVRQLIGDLKRAGEHLRGGSGPPRALVAIERPVAVPERDAGRGESCRRSEGRTPRPAVPDMEVQRTNVSELLISNLMQAMQRDLAEAESHFVKPGLGSTARGRFGRAMQWAMLGTAYGVEAKTNQIAMASFLGSEGASWLYGLVGPVLIGGLPSLITSKTGKGAAYALMMTWALATASITASEKGYLERAQAYFPRRAEVLAQEKVVGAARVRKDAGDAELKRLEAPPKDASAAVSEATRRWQLPEIRRAAKRESAIREKARAEAREAVIAAGVALNGEELRLREALLNDPSRGYAWWTLFAIFGVINLAGPLAISRLVEQWRSDYAEAEAHARDGHRKKSAAALLRDSRSAQKAHAMLLLPGLLEGLGRGGVAREVIAGLDLSDISQKAAERFDRGINGKRAGRRLFGFRGPAEGPG